MVRQDIKMDTKLENLWKLHASAWASFQRRADHEFRFSVAVWTAVVASIGLELKMDFLPSRLASVACCLLPNFPCRFALVV